MPPRVSGSQRGNVCPLAVWNAQKFASSLIFWKAGLFDQIPWCMDFCLFLMLSFSLSTIVFYTDGTFRALVLIRHLTWRFEMVWSEKVFFFSLYLLLPHFYWSMALFRIITWMDMLNEDAGSDPLCLLLKDVLMAMDFKWWFTELKTGYGCN